MAMAIARGAEQREKGKKRKEKKRRMGESRAAVAEKAEGSGRARPLCLSVGTAVVLLLTG
jgi:hypothetical protein